MTGGLTVADPYPWHSLVRVRVDSDARRLARLFAREGVRRVVDVGCGPGRYTLYFARRGFQVDAFDQSPIAVELTRAALQVAGLEARLKIASMTERFPYESSSFDASVAIRVIQYATVREMAILTREMRRVTRPGGLIYVQTGVTPQPGKPMRRARFRAAVVPKRGAQRGIVHHFPTEGAVVSSFGSSSFMRSWRVGPRVGFLFRRSLDDERSLGGYARKPGVSASRSAA
jgi:SAM-dependent methyltransferase